MVQFIDLSTVELISLDDLIKGRVGGFLHGYFTKLHTKETKQHTIPVERFRKDGVKQIYWVSPDELKAKLRHVSGHGEGTEDHLEHIKNKFGLEEKDLIKFSHGDKVKIVSSKDTDLHGKEAIVHTIQAVSEQNPTPMLSLRLKNERTGKYGAKSVNVNDVELIHPATPKTVEEISPSTVKVKTLAGRDISVSRTEFDKYYKDKTPGEIITPKEQHEKLIHSVEEDAILTRTRDGKKFRVVSLKMGKDSVTIRPFEGGADATRSQTVSAEKLRDAIAKGQLTKDPPPPQANKDEKPESYRLESGQMHDSGEIFYDDAGQPQFTKEGQERAWKIVLENEKSITKGVYQEATGYSTLSKADVEDIYHDNYEKLLRQVSKYEPYLNNHRGVEAWLYGATRNYTRNAVAEMHQENVANAIANGDMEGEEEDQSFSDELPISAFKDPHALIEMQEGIEHEQEFINDIYKDPEVADVMMRLVGIGRVEQEIKKKEAAAELAGKDLYGTGKPVTETKAYEWIRAQLDGLGNRLKGEVEKGTDIARDLRSNYLAKKSFLKKRGYDTLILPTEKVTISKPEVKKDTYLEVKASLIRNGVSLQDAPKIYESVRGIMNGIYTPAEYSGLIPKKYVNAVGRTLDEHKVRLFKTYKEEKISKDGTVTTEMVPKEIKFVDIVQNRASINRKATKKGKDFRSPFAFDTAKSLLGVVDGYEIYRL